MMEIVPNCSTPSNANKRCQELSPVVSPDAIPLPNDSTVVDTTITRSTRKQRKTQFKLTTDEDAQLPVPTSASFPCVSNADATAASTMMTVGFTPVAVSVTPGNVTAVSDAAVTLTASATSITTTTSSAARLTDSVVTSTSSRVSELSAAPASAADEARAHEHVGDYSSVVSRARASGLPFRYVFRGVKPADTLRTHLTAVMSECNDVRVMPDDRIETHSFVFCNLLKSAQMVRNACAGTDWYDALKLYNGSAHINKCATPIQLRIDGVTTAMKTNIWRSANLWLSTIMTNNDVLRGTEAFVGDVRVPANSIGVAFIDVISDDTPGVIAAFTDLVKSRTVSVRGGARLRVTYAPRRQATVANKLYLRNLAFRTKQTARNAIAKLFDNNVTTRVYSYTGGSPVAGKMVYSMFIELQPAIQNAAFNAAATNLFHAKRMIADALSLTAEEQAVFRVEIAYRNSVTPVSVPTQRQQQPQQPPRTPAVLPPRTTKNAWSTPLNMSREQQIVATRSELDDVSALVDVIEANVMKLEELAQQGDTAALMGLKLVSLRMKFQQVNSSPTALASPVTNRVTRNAPPVTPVPPPPAPAPEQQLSRSQPLQRTVATAAGRPPPTLGDFAPVAASQRPRRSRRVSATAATAATVTTTATTSAPLSAQTQLGSSADDVSVVSASDGNSSRTRSGSRLSGQRSSSSASALTADSTVTTTSATAQLAGSISGQMALEPAVSHSDQRTSAPILNSGVGPMQL